MRLVEGQIRRFVAGCTEPPRGVAVEQRSGAAERVTQALFQMKKIVIADLEAAATA